MGGDGSERVWQFGVVPLGTLPDGRRIRLLAGTDLTELKSAARRRQLLVDELNHRVKNTLAIVQAIAAQTAEHTADPDDFNLKFVERLQVLARTHDQLTARAWDSIPLADILEAELAAIRSPTAQVELSGDAEVLLPAQSALIAAMVFHELAVNALQHGCFQRPGGRLRVVWRATTRHDAGTDDDYVSIEWEETCTWALPAQGASGFGMRLLSRAGAALGSGTMAMRPEGVHVTLRIRVPGLSPPEVPSSPRREEALAG
jgi:two-component sensor histidine kinase